MRKTLMPDSTPIPASRPRARLLWLWVIPALLLACWLGARGLDADAIWNDEFYSIHDAGGPPYGPLSPAEIWERVATRNPWHTPGYFIALSGWGALVGWTPPMLRAFSLLVGLLGIAWTYRLGRDLVSPQVGVYAAAVLSASAFFIHYMHEIRMYTLFVLLTAFTIWVYLRIVRGKPTLLHWLGLFLGALGILYTHYFAALPLAAVALYHIVLYLFPLSHKGRGDSRNVQAGVSFKKWLGVVAALGLAGLLFVPWLGWLLKGLQMAADSEGLHERALSAPQALAALLELFGNGSALFTLVGLALALLLLKRRGAREAWFWMLATVAAVLVTNAILEIMHEGRVRYLITAWPLLAIVVGMGIARLTELPRRSDLAFGVLALWMANGAVSSLNPAFAATVDGGAGVFPLHQVAYALRDDIAPDDVLVSYLPDGFPFWVYERNQQITQFYFNGIPFSYTTARTMRDPATQPAEQQETLDAVGESPRLWLAYEPERPASTMPELMSVLDDAYALCGVPVESSGLRIELYARTPVCCAPNPDAPLIDYGDIQLSAIEPLPARVSGTLRLTSAWVVADNVPADTYSVALHLLDENGNLAAQADKGLPHVAFACQNMTLDLAGVTSGQYTLNLIVYRWQDGARLPGTLTTTGQQGDSLPLGTVEVE